MVLLFTLLKYNEKYEQKWIIKAAHINEGFPGWDPDILQEYLSSKKVQLVVKNCRIYERLKKAGDKCFICSRARRNKLMEIAEEFDIFNIALAHHQEDAAETLLLNMFFTGRMGTLLPRQPIVHGRFNIIRPLYYMEKNDIEEIARVKSLPAFKSPCPYYVDSRRQLVRRLLRRIKNKNPDVYTNLFRSIFNMNKPYMP